MPLNRNHEPPQGPREEAWVLWIHHSLPLGWPSPPAGMAGKPATPHVIPVPCRLAHLCKGRTMYTAHLLYVNSKIKRQALSPGSSAVLWSRRLPTEGCLGTNGFYLSSHLNSKHLCSCIKSFPFQVGGWGDAASWAEVGFMGRYF